MFELPAKQANAREVLSPINSITGSRGTLLDIGCFCGVFLSVAAQDGWNCFGLEPLVMPAIYARSQFGLNIKTDILRDNTYEANSFDLVTAFQVFEHLVEPVPELINIHRILIPNGLLVLEVPNIDTFLFKCLQSKHRHFVQDHVSFFSAQTLLMLLWRLGFAMKQVYYPARLMSVSHLLWWMKRDHSQAKNDWVDHAADRLSLKEILEG
jgi:2-polyprenyl-3-methyl-5-hydroxy-6-metoxy-1,4-benzoquinol methylase